MKKLRRGTEGRQTAERRFRGLLPPCVIAGILPDYSAVFPPDEAVAVFLAGLLSG
jgi:hypothetical protein